MVSSKLLKHSVIVAIDYWLAHWTSSKTNLSGADTLNGTSPAYGANSTVSAAAVRNRLPTDSCSVRTLSLTLRVFPCRTTPTSCESS